MPYDVAALRRAEFPWAAQCLYLNHASTGPLPERTRLALEAFGRERAAPCGLSSERLMGILAESRRLAARLINAEPGEIALATNTSYGLNLAARMLPLAPGEVVLVCDREFPANVYPWLRLERLGVRCELVPLTPEGWPDETRLVERMGDPRVRALSVSLVQFHNGYRVDLDALSRAARATGTWLVVDAIQALGQIPFDVRATPVDVLACGAQKWLLSPWGAGFLYVRRELVQELEPPLAGWMAFQGTDDFSQLTEYRPTLRDDARRFELVTLPFQDFVGMNRGLELLLELGIEEIRAHLAAIAEPVLGLARRRGFPLASPPPTGVHGSGMVCLTPPDPAGVFRRLGREGVVCTLREGAIRLSPHCYNTLDEMERVAELLGA